MKLELDMPRKEWKVLQEELEYHMGYMGSPPPRLTLGRCSTKSRRLSRKHYETHQVQPWVTYQHPLVIHHPDLPLSLSPNL